MKAGKKNSLEKAAFGNLRRQSIIDIQSMKLLQNSSKISQIQSRLNKYTYLSQNNLPGYLDGIIFTHLNSIKVYPDRKTNPNFYHWYILMRQFAAPTISKWIQDRLYEDPQDSLISKFVAPLKQELLQEIEETTASEEYDQLPLSLPRNLAALNNDEDQYIIEILLRKNSEKEVESIKRCIRQIQLKKNSCAVELVIRREERKIKIKCPQKICKCQEIANFISSSVQYQNMQIKRQRKPRSLKNYG